MKSVLQRSDGRFDTLNILMNNITEVDMLLDIMYRTQSDDDFNTFTENQQLFIQRLKQSCEEATK